MIATVSSTKSEAKLPKGWRWAKLGEVLHRLSPATRRLKTHEYKQTGRIAVVDQGQELIAGYTDDSTARTGVGLPVLVFGDHTKVVKYVDFDFAIGADGVVLLEAAHGVDLRFLHYGLCQVQLPDMGYGRHYQFLADQEIPLPPLHEQKRIVAILNEQMAAVERARKAAEERRAAVNDLPSAYLRAVFPAPDQPLPEGWRWVQLGDIFDITSSKRVFESQWMREGVPFYRAREIVLLAQQGFVDNDLFISEDMFEEYASKYGRPHPGDIMVTGVGTLGVCYVVREGDRFYFKDGNIIWLKRCSENSSAFIEYAFESDVVREQVQDSSGATVGTFTIEKAKKTRMPLAPLLEQERIVTILNAQMATVNRAQEAAGEELATTNALPAALLRKAFAGEL